MAASIRLATAGNVRGFQTLSGALNDSDGKWSHLVDYEGLQDEIGRFRVWSGNLGALQKGHSSLDYRLRDSPLLSSNALKFLQDLDDNINEAIAIVTQARLPYEAQPKPEKSEDDEEDDDDDSFFDEDEDEDDDDGVPRSELSMRFAEVVDIIDNLYKLSVRIRTPTIRSRSLKAATFKPKDPETGVDILSTYAVYDVQHVKELLFHLRQGHEQDAQSTDHDYLINRLSAAITLRRRQFKYWKRHRDKLGISTLQEESIPANQPPVDRPSLPHRNDTLEVLPDIPVIAVYNEAPSQKTGKTLLSGTEATQHHQSLDEIVDTKSVTSYAVTVKDLHGRGVDLPPPPRAADGEKDFECPYCYIICPARYGRGRAWRTHLLQDLQPYVCTYPECESFEQLFRSRREWAEHEASHRKVWRCPEHTAAVYKSNAALEEHFRHEHADTIPENQVSAIVKVGETTTIDVRTQCPICFAPADTEGLGDFHNHIANHLERIATFALPNGNEDEADGASSAASRGRSDSSQSRNLSDLSLPTDASDTMAIETEQKTNLEEVVLEDELPHPEDIPEQIAGGATLSAQSLEQLPDSSDTRLETLLAGRSIKNDNSIEALDSDTDSSVYLDSDSDDGEGHEGAKKTLQVSDIPTLRSLYRSRRLLQRDQSFNPNDSYNQIISLCHHDLTKIEVDAIINGANRAMKVTLGETLNNTIHRAAGPGLARETKTTGRLKKEAILTGGYRLPSKHVIHVLRPGYTASSGMGQFNQLVDCYRNAFNMAINHELKTLAFPCLGTGGVGFPARVAARIVLQEVREYLDKHPEYKFERVVFCVNTAADEMAYIDFLPVFFPPTHDDLEAARSSVWTGDRATGATEALKARNEIQKVVWDLNLGFGITMPNFDHDITSHFRAIDQALVSIRQCLLSSNEVTDNLRDLRLLCTVMQLFCGSIAEAIDLANDHLNVGQRKDREIWRDFVTTMDDLHGRDPSWLLETCHYFAQSLENMITKNGVGADEIVDLIDVRQKLERYKSKQRGGRDADGTQDHLNEVLYTREFQRQTIAQSRENVKLHKIPTVTQLYKLGELEEKTTLARPSIEFNDKICLAREDITKIEVDVMVNSADEAFEGIGALARTVFNKGGVQLREAVQTFGKCKAGDVRLTGGFLLPAKHILHVIPPDQLRQDTKDVMRKIYREVLYTAVTLGATSIALPSIGTGLLNFPRRDCVSIALEEAKRFLESSIPGSLIEKIVFVVYSSNDEFVYKSLMPVYFPPPDMNVNRALPASIVRQDTATTTSSSSSETPRRNLFGSIGEAFRSLRAGKPSGASRPISSNEEHALISFEAHAKDCETCKDIDKLYLEGRDLCKNGDELAKIILWHMNMESDLNVYAHPPVQGKSTKLEIPPDMFPISLKLLATVEKSQRDGNGTRPFVARDRPYGATSQDQRQNVIPPGVTIHSGEVQISKESEPKRARAHVLIMNHTGEWEPVASEQCHIVVSPNSIDVFEHLLEGVGQVPLMSNVFTSQSKVQRRKTTPEVELYGCPRFESTTYTAEAVLFRCRSDNECNSLLRAIRQALDDFKALSSSDTQQQTPAPPAATEQNTSREYLAWNQRLKDIQSELAAVKQASGGLSDLQYKMERLGMATASLNTGAEEDSNVSNLYDASRSPLATRILVLLTADLKSRPGSYIGLKTDRIIEELPATEDEVRSALQELIEQDQVHNTVDGDTWVVSHPPKDLPVLSKEQYSEGQARRVIPPPIRETGFEYSEPQASSSSRVENDKTDQAPDSAPNSQASRPDSVEAAGERSAPSLNLIAPSPTVSHDGNQNEKGYPIPRLHEQSDNPVVGDVPDLNLIQPSPPPSDDGNQENDSDEEPHPAIGNNVHDQTQHRNHPATSPDLTSATLSSNTKALTLDPSDRLEDSAYHVSPSGSIWTFVENNVVYSKVLIDTGEEFDDMGRQFLVHREIGRAQLYEWIRQSVQRPTEERLLWDEEKRKWRAEARKKHAEELERELEAAGEALADLEFSDTSEQPGADRFPDSAYQTSPSGTIWTRIDKSMADSRVLVADGEVFDDMGDHWLVHREISRHDVDEWMAKGRALLPSEKPAEAKDAQRGRSGISIPDVSNLPDSLPSPPRLPPYLLSNDEILRLGTDRLPDSDYFISLSGQVWTRIKKRHVYSQMLVAANESFDDAGTHFLVYRAVGKNELMQWVLDTHRLESPEKEKWEEEKRRTETYDEGSPSAAGPTSALPDAEGIHRLGADRLPDSDYYESPTGSTWTRVKKIYVYSGALVAANEEFSDSGSEFLVHRAAGKSDMRQWTEATRSLTPAEKEKWEEEQSEAREALQMAPGTPFDLLRKAWNIYPEDGHTTTTDLGLEPQQAENVVIRGASPFADMPPSPTEPSSVRDDQLHLDTQNLDDVFSYASPSGARWTRVDKRLIDPRILAAADEEFEDVGDGLVVHRVLRRGEVDRWAEESLRVREGDKGKGKEGESEDANEREVAAEPPKEQESAADPSYTPRAPALLHRAPAQGGRAMAPTRRRRQSHSGDTSASHSNVNAPQEDEGKGKEREKDDRDAHQERLDRVIAGDMREEELRRFADDGGEERLSR